MAHLFPNRSTGMAVFNDEEVKAELIRLVRTRPHLWKFRDKDYRKANLRKKAFQEIASAINSEFYTSWTGEEAYKEYKKMEDYFTQNRKPTFVTGDGADAARTTAWTFDENFKFLLENDRDLDRPRIVLGIADHAVLTSIGMEQNKSYFPAAVDSPVSRKTKKRRRSDAPVDVDCLLTEAVDRLSKGIIEDQNKSEAKVFGDFVGCSLGKVEERDPFLPST